MNGQPKYRLSASKRAISASASFMWPPRPPPHVLAMNRSKSVSNTALRAQHDGNSNTVEAELRRRREKKEEKDRVAKLKREYKAELSRSKRAKYSNMSGGGVLRDLRSGMSTLKHSFDQLLGQKLRLRSPKVACASAYGQLLDENEDVREPVKMYSPFSIESPVPVATAAVVKKRLDFGGERKARRALGTINQPKAEVKREPSMTLLASPTGKIRDDVRSITHSMNELSMISQDIQYKFSMVSQSPSCFSIQTQ